MRSCPTDSASLATRREVAHVSSASSAVMLGSTVVGERLDRARATMTG
jgi:hypothetical protein